MEPGTAKLKDALATTDKTAVVFGTDLGPSPVANRATLNGALATGLKAATLKVVADSSGDANEAIQVFNDTISCANNLDFLGQTSAKRIDKQDTNNPILSSFCSMPVKLDFPDRNTRTHFQSTLRKHCNLKASIFLPAPIRKYQSLYLNAVRERHPGKAVMVCPDTANMSLVAFVKDEGVGAWSRCPGLHPIPRGIMLPGYLIPNRIDLPAAAETEVGDSMTPSSLRLPPVLNPSPELKHSLPVNCYQLPSSYP